MCSRWRTIDDRRRTEVTGVRVSHCCARQGGYGVVPTLVRGYFNGPPLWICRCLITAVLNSALRRAIPPPAARIAKISPRIQDSMKPSFEMKFELYLGGDIIFDHFQSSLSKREIQIDSI